MVRDASHLKTLFQAIITFNAGFLFLNRTTRSRLDGITWSVGLFENTISTKSCLVNVPLFLYSDDNCLCPLMIMTMQLLNLMEIC
jgi:hypothetical protein